ncbi:MAG: DUF748 domain-containing protein [Pseudomonadales bacterium]|nr:DUF748 domain-containing protein [Pseudomonadales bacterium]
MSNKTSAHAETPKKNPQKNSNTLHMVLGIITAMLLTITVALPDIAQLVLINQLEQQGADNVTIDDLDINLFSGNIALHGLSITTQDNPPLTIGYLSLKIPYWQAFNKQFTITNIQLQNAVIPIVKTDAGDLIIGLALANNKQPTNSTAEAHTDLQASTTPPVIQQWKISLQHLQFENVTLKLLSKELSSSFNIERFEISNLTNWSPSASKITLDASVSDLNKNDKIQVFAEGIQLKTSQIINLSQDGSMITLDLNADFSIDQSSLEYENFKLDSQLEKSAIELTFSYDMQNDTPLAWHINRFDLSQLNIQFKDQSVEPVFSPVLDIESLQVGEIGNQTPDTPTDLALIATIDRHSKVSLTGTVTPLAKKISANMKASVKGLELVPLSAYIDKAIGYHIHSGKLDFNGDINIADDQLDSSAVIKINNIKLTPANDEAVEKLTKQLTMPLDLMLSVLRDTDNNVQIEIPIRGDINNPDFDINDVLQQATAKATRYAALSLLKNALQPYTTMISVAEFAYEQGKALTALKLDPIIFQPEQTQLNPQQIAYLTKISALMKERPELRVRLCGVGFLRTPLEQEIAQIKGDNGGESTRTQLQTAKALGHGRELSAMIKIRLINQHKVSSERLFSCQTTVKTIDHETTGKAQVDLLL